MCDVDTPEVIEAESHEVLNTLTEHDFQDALQNSRSAGNDEHAQKGTTSRVMVASRPKISLWQDGSTSQRNYGLFFVWTVFSLFHKRHLMMLCCPKIRPGGMRKCFPGHNEAISEALFLSLRPECRLGPPLLAHTSLRSSRSAQQSATCPNASWRRVNRNSLTRWRGRPFLAIFTTIRVRTDAFAVWYKFFRRRV
jgi:hypothetical protein